MGTGSSKLQEPELEELKSITTLSVDEINRLYSRFKQLDKARQGSIKTDDMLAIPELAMNPLANRIVAVIDAEGRREINFKQFLQNLSVFSKDTKREDKLEFAFKVYDVNGDGYIDNGDLKAILTLMVGRSLREEEIQHLVDKTILEADTIDKDGSISFDEFKRALFSADLERVLSIQFS
ncbi:Calcineurin subunit B type 2 [Phlyctochytrium planicorne]|nr:Calcineurin subunit B type 2 [Phlyctochytrium planicorne]